MCLKRNSSLHWILPNGAELHSGDQVELFQGDCWIVGEIQYRPYRDYQIRLDNGQVIDLCEELILRLRRPEWTALKRTRDA